MAKIEYNPGDFGRVLDRLMDRQNIRDIVEAGSAAAVKELVRRTNEKHHVVKHGLERGIQAGPLHEDLGKAWQYVYPMGEGDHGQDLAVVGFVINYYKAKKKDAKTGDKFITGNKKQLEDVVRQAMAAKAEQIKNDIMR